MHFQNSHDKRVCLDANSAKAIAEDYNDTAKAQERLEKIQNADIDIKISQYKLLAEQNILLGNQLREQKNANLEAKRESIKLKRMSVIMLVIAIISALVAVASLIVMILTI